MQDRDKLPFRKNCEGYFLDENNKILTKQTNGILVFPGGGVDNNEDIEKAIIRETFEETGAIIESLKKLGELKFIWGPDWAKSEKQKNRYIQYKGEEMHFFTGKIKEFKEPEKKEEDFWEGEKLMPIEEAIKIIESEVPFDEEIKKYRDIQLRYLNKIFREQK